jgi:p-hydroxybenzoate 3-monooxygenase
MTGTRTNEWCLPARWLVVTGAAAPLENHTIYAAHPNGFAGHMRRGADHTRYYLEVAATDNLSDWPPARIRDELTIRLGAGSRLADVRFEDAYLLDLRTRVIEPMQDGRLFLAGDAAHLITPAGGKGMNLAIQDAVELASGVIERFGPRRDGARLAAYSATRLPAVWRAEAFSSWFLHILLASLRDGDEPSYAVPGGFARGIRNGWISAMQTDPLLTNWFSHAYAGVDPD